MNDNIFFCRVCGLYRPEMPWGEDEETPSFEICPCCGVEFGNEDYAIASIRHYRENWLKKGGKWFNYRLKPDDWNIEIQMKQISSKYL